MSFGRTVYPIIANTDRSYQISMITANQIFEIYGTNYRQMTLDILERSDLAALIGSRDTRIAVKPNLVTPSPAQFGGTTHTEIIAGIIEYLRAHGFQKIIIAEGSWVGDKTSEAYEYCGYRTLCENYDVPFIDTQKLRAHPIDCAGMKISVTDVVDDFDFLINVPVLKGHCQTKMTCALKNLKGLLPNTEKRRFHKMGLHKPIAHLSAGIHQDFIVVDHICGDPDFEEGGNPLVSNCIMTALDPVLVDSYACDFLGLDISEVPYVGMAQKLGLGSTDLDSADIITIGKTDAQAEKAGGKRRVLDVSYKVDDVDSCSACYGNLIPSLYRLQEEGLLDDLKDPIAIGQGHQGRTGKLGVGRCTKDYAFCIMGCPPDEETIYKKLKEYIEGQR